MRRPPVRPPQFGPAKMRGFFSHAQPNSLIAMTLSAGLQQFPVVSNDYKADLKKLDPAYADALKAINKADANAGEKERIRNEEIDRRLAVIDANFKKYEIALAKENVQSDFLVAVIQVGLGGAGAIASQTVSQILSAVGGGLAGVKEAYGKAALFEKALSALIQQMIASRKAILVKIYEGRAQSIVDYPLSAAVQDLDAYYFAGSLPGAVIATSADATVKNNQAEKKLKNLFVRGPVPKDVQARRVRASNYIWDLVDKNEDAKLRSLANALGVPENEDALDGILDRITAARTAEDMETIEQEIEVFKRQ